jgi:hypothetical protein
MINNILKKIEKANEVQKVELEKHEVELALFDNFKNAQSASQNMYGNAVGKALNLEKNFNDVLSDLKMAQQAAERAKAVGDKFENDIKSLGIDLPPMYNSIKERLFDDSKRIEKAVNTINKIKSELRF